jgi:hypothetical protein
MLVLTECALFFIVFLLVSEVYTVDNYSREGMLNTCFSLVVLALAFFVPMNVAAKIPSVHRQVESWSAMVTAQLSRLGIKVTRVWTLDARFRYHKENEELRESINEIRLSQVHADAEGLDVGLNDEALAKRKVTAALSVHEPRDRVDHGDDDESVELSSFCKRNGRSGGQKGIAVVVSPVHTSNSDC